MLIHKAQGLHLQWSSGKLSISDDENRWIQCLYDDFRAQFLSLFLCPTAFWAVFIFRKSLCKCDINSSRLTWFIQLTISEKHRDLFFFTTHISKEGILIGLSLNQLLFMWNAVPQLARPQLCVLCRPLYLLVWRSQDGLFFLYPHTTE